MKQQITNYQAKQLRNLYWFWYCEIQELLTYEDPIYYTAGIYWRKADFYKIEDPDTFEYYRISTWYWSEGIRINYELTRQAEQQARKIGQNKNYYNYKARRLRNRKRIIKLIREGRE